MIFLESSFMVFSLFGIAPMTAAPLVLATQVLQVEISQKNLIKSKILYSCPTLTCLNHF